MNNQADKMPTFQDYRQIDNSLDLITQSPGLHHILEKVFLNVDILSILECEQVNSVWKSVLNHGQRYSILLKRHARNSVKCPCKLLQPADRPILGHFGTGLHTRFSSAWSNVECVLNNPKIFLHKIYQNVSRIKTPEYFDYFEMYKRFEVMHITLTKPEDCQHFGFSVIMWPSQFFAGRNEICIHGVSRALNQLKKGTNEINSK